MLRARTDVQFIGAVTADAQGGQAATLESLHESRAQTPCELSIHVSKTALLVTADEQNRHTLPQIAYASDGTDRERRTMLMEPSDRLTVTKDLWLLSF